MGLFDFLKKKEERHFDPVNITVRDLGKGYIFEYEAESWTVIAVFEYDWGENYFTREFVIKNGEKEKFLHIEEDGGLTVTLSEKLKIRHLGDAVLDRIEEKGKPPKKIEYENVTYYLDEKSYGYSKEIDSEKWEELISYDYLDKNETKTLCIEQYSEENFEASIGKIIKETSISDILPIEGK
jgi:hypothetical protein